MWRSGLLVVLVSVVATDAAKILFLAPFTSHSHIIYTVPIVNELAARGHSVTFWNGMKPREELHSNVTLFYTDTLHDFNVRKPVSFGINDPLLWLMEFPTKIAEICEAIYDDTVFHQMRQSQVRYDLIVMEAWINECALPFVVQFNAPFVYVTVLESLPWIQEATGSPLGLNHYPLPSSPYTDQMSLWERAANTWTTLLVLTFRNWAILPAVDRVVRQSWPRSMNLPPVKEIENNVSLCIVNSHPIINYQYPKNAAVIQAPALQVAASKPLPADLEEFVNGSGDAGVVILSFGSVLRGDRLPVAARDTLVRTFGRLKQRVIWKWENGDGIPNLPSNVLLSSWFPQVDLLAHPKTKLFLSHCGISSIQETSRYGVPLVALPVFGDQLHHARKAEKDGYAVLLNWMTMTDDELYAAIQEVLHNPKYKDRISKISELMSDHQNHPLDVAVYWIEYVIRHGGAAHLRTSASALSLAERIMLDVIALTALVIAVLVFVICRFARFLCRQLSNQPVDPVKKNH